MLCQRGHRSEQRAVAPLREVVASTWLSERKGRGRGERACSCSTQHHSPLPCVMVTAVSANSPENKSNLYPLNATSPHAKGPPKRRKREENEAIHGWNRTTPRDETRRVLPHELVGEGIAPLPSVRVYAAHAYTAGTSLLFPSSREYAATRARLRHHIPTRGSTFH